MSKQPKTPWKNGHYCSDQMTPLLLKVDGNNVDFKYLISIDYPNMSSWTYGDFGPARKEIEEVSGGVKNYNIKINGLGCPTSAA